MNIDWLIGARDIPAPVRTVDVDEPVMLYTDFVAELGFILDPGQWVFARVCFDGVDPANLETPEQRAIATAMFGGIEAFSEAQRAVIVAVCGGRAGKTRMNAMRLLHLALTVPLPSLAPGEVASAPIIAPDLDLATQPLDYIKGACRHPDILPLVMNPNHLEPQSEGIDIRRDDGRMVEIICRAASAKGRTGRGRTLVGALLDETAFFFDKSYKVCDDEVFKAVRPRVAPGGQTLIASTPWAQSGLLYDLFAANHGAPGVAGIDTPARREGTALAVHASSTQLRDDEHLAAMVAAETTRDPENALREFGAHFMGAGAETFFDAACITASVDYTMPQETLPTPGYETTCGADLGFATNSSALAIGHLGVKTLEVGYLREWKPEPGKPLRPSATVRDMAADMKRHGATVVMSDAHYRETFIEHLSDAGLGFVDAPSIPAAAFVKTRTMMREGRIRMAEYPRLLRQMRETVARKTSGGGVQIVLPRWKTGEHGDLLSAFVLMCYQAGGELVEADAPKMGTKAYYDAQHAARIAARLVEVNRQAAPFWKRGIKRP